MLTRDVLSPVTQSLLMLMRWIGFSESGCCTGFVQYTWCWLWSWWTPGSGSGSSSWCTGSPAWWTWGPPGSLWSSRARSQTDRSPALPGGSQSGTVSETSCPRSTASLPWCSHRSPSGRGNAPQTACPGRPPAPWESPGCPAESRTGSWESHQWCRCSLDWSWRTGGCTIWPSVQLWWWRRHPKGARASKRSGPLHRCCWWRHEFLQIES